jgi:hypothetical protein
MLGGVCWLLACDAAAAASVGVWARREMYNSWRYAVKTHCARATLKSFFQPLMHSMPHVTTVHPSELKESLVNGHHRRQAGARHQLSAFSAAAPHLW